MSGRALIAIDWGTTSLRAALLDARGAVQAERSAPQGILAVPAGGFATVFHLLTADWVAQGARLCLMAGMVGSRQGWEEAPYCACPAGFGEVAVQLRWLAELAPAVQAAIVPGLRCTHDGVPDVMRGEETQVFGALSLLGLDSGTCVLPGTHSKWVQVEGSRITGFATCMTGELYGLLRQHSILARTLPAEDGPLDRDAFLQGVRHAREAGSLLAAAFSVRTLALFESLPASWLPSYLSGLVIGEELRTQAPAHTGSAPVLLVGAPALTERYALALQAWDLPARSLGPEATWRGLWAIAQTLESSP